MIVTYELTHEDQDRFEEITGTHAAASDSCPGCLRFRVGKDIQHAGHHQLIEQQENREGLDQHAAPEAFRRTVQALSTCDIRGMQPDRYEVV
ncbi:putative quinol monooxygenase [Kineococcus sp. GCM10028916]|uniref:putative quinol monooxygenase n=1 Tax=Kineococcus sp. GCM10028916 TaxID=3273394 RepID=UPI00362E1055